MSSERFHPATDGSRYRDLEPDITADSEYRFEIFESVTSEIVEAHSKGGRKTRNQMGWKQ